MPHSDPELFKAAQKFYGIKPTEIRIESYPSGYGTYIVRVDGQRVYETTNKVKARGVTEYLASYSAVTPIRTV